MNIALLKALCEIPGHEDRVRDLIAREVEGLFDEVTTIRWATGSTD